jgi:isoquinoline 1-oxidoreductase beta subunit
MARLKKIARRSFLVGTVALGGAAVFGTYVVARPHDNPLAEDLPEGAVAFNPWVRIDAERITLITPHAEIGQGAQHMQAILLAEELDLELGQFETETGTPSAAYWNGAFADEASETLTALVPLPATVLHGMLTPVLKLAGMQGTGGSTSTPDAFVKMRAAAASARETLKLAAARVHDLDPARLTTEAGAVVLPDGRRVRYQELAGVAATIPPVQDVPLRAPESWRLVGRPTERIDMAAKCTGAQVYGIDLVAPGMVHATPVTNPRRGPMLGYDATDALAIPGVRDVVEITNGVAVIADGTWAAFEGARAIRFDWGPAPYPAEQAEHWAEAEASFTEERLQATWRDDGDVAAAGPPAVEAAYRAPYIAHQPLEPLGALVTVTDDAIEVDAGHQQPTQLRQVLAAVTGTHAPEQVIFRNRHSGGSFGHRLEFDFLRQAVQVADRMRGTPVKLTYSREEDFAQDFPRHLAVARGTGTVADGKVTGMSLDVAGTSVFASQFPRAGLPLPPGPDSQITAGTFSAPYGNLPNFRVRGYAVPNLAPTSSWRAVGASYGGFLVETLLDELIHVAGADPVEERLRLIDDPVARGVLAACAEAAGWTGPDRGKGRFAGVALVHSFGVPCAEIVEVEATDRGIAIRNVWVVADPGTVVDPVNIENQIQGGVVWGLGHAMNSEITYRDGMAEQRNFHDAEGMRFHQCPEIHVRVLQDNPRIRGIGEPPVPPAFPALGNAIFAATGQRLRETPFDRFVDFV